MLKHKHPDHLLISLSIRFYKFLLLFYPPCFRLEYGPHMVQVFRDACLDAYREAGFLAMFKLWARTFFDWIKSVIEEQLQRETAMTREKFIRLSGWAMIFGAIGLGLGIFMQLDWIRLMLYRTLGTPNSLAEYNYYWDLAQRIGEFPSILGFILEVVGIQGLRMCYQGRVGKNGQTFLNLSLAGGLVGLSALGLRLAEGNTWWLLVSGFIMMFCSLAMFGFEANKRDILGSFQATLLLSGFWFPIWMVLSMVLEFLNDGHWVETPRWIEVPAWVTIVAALVLLGQALKGEARFREPVG